MTDLLSGAALRERAQLALDVPLAAALGSRLLDPADPAAGATFRIERLAANGAGSAHAAAVATLLELAGYLALAPELAAAEHAVTHAMAMQLVAAAPDGADVTARGSVDRRTGRLAFVSATATIGDQLIARAQLTKSIVAFGA